MTRIHSLRTTAIVGALAALTGLGACAPLLIGGAIVGGSMMAIDRRSSGTQVDDQSIELKAINRVSETIGDRGHVNTTSYNRLVLITGEVPTEADKVAVEQAVAKIESVRSIVNELGIAGASSLGARSNDTILTSKVKASLVDAKDLQSNTIKVVTERSTVFLMGRVTEREAKRATEVARGVSGVQKVVRVFEPISETELSNLQPAPAASATASPRP